MHMKYRSTLALLQSYVDFIRGQDISYWGTVSDYHTSEGNTSPVSFDSPASLADRMDSNSLSLSPIVPIRKEDRCVSSSIRSHYTDTVNSIDHISWDNLTNTSVMYEYFYFLILETIYLLMFFRTSVLMLLHMPFSL